MLSYETERKLANLLQAISFSEGMVEHSRQELCKNPDFDPSGAFLLLDPLSTGGITAYDLNDFLSRAGFHTSINELDLLIKQYDSDYDGRLSYPNFLQLVLPSENKDLRDTTESRRRSLPTPLIVLEELAKHIYLEAIKQGELAALKKTLSLSPDFNNLDAFRAIDKEGIGHIMPYQLNTFLQRNGFSIVESTIDRVIRRIDNDGDSRLSYSEFIEALIISEPVPFENRVSSGNSQFLTSSPVRPWSPQRAPLRGSPVRSSLRESAISSPVRIMPRHTNPLRGSPIRSSFRETSPLKNSGHLRNFSLWEAQLRASGPLRPLRESPLRKSVENSIIRASLSKPVPHSDMNEIVNIFRSQMNLERDLEESKISLSMQVDFTIEDFFRLADLSDKGHILSADLESLLTDLGVFFTLGDIYLLIKHYSSLQNSRLGVSDFQKMWQPKDIYYANLISARRPAAYPPTNRMTMFSKVTLEKIADVFRMFIECEKLAEDLRKSLAAKYWINLLEVFSAVDKDEDGYIAIGEFGDVLREFGVYVNEKDLKGLVERYDKNYDGRVSYSEFIQEITPKLA